MSISAAGAGPTHAERGDLRNLQMREIVRAMAQLFPSAIVSGRGREKVQSFVQLQELFYAGSHGMDIVGPQVQQ